MKKAIGILALALLLPISVSWAARPILTSQGGHTDRVTKVALSQDKKWLASAGADRTVKLWDLASGRLVRSFSVAARTLALSPDNQYMASSDYDSKIYLWDLKNGQNIKILSGHLAGINSLVFTPTGSQLISGSADRTVKIWDIPSGREAKTLGQASPGIADIVQSPNRRYVLILGRREIAKLWDLELGREVTVMKYEGERPARVEFSLKSQYAVIHHSKGTDWYETSTGRKAGSAKPGNLWFSPDESRLLVASQGSIELFDVHSGSRLKAFVDEWFRFNGENRIFSNDSRSFLIVGKQKSFLCNSETGATVKEFQGIENIEFAFFNSNGKQLVTSNRKNRHCALRDAKNGDLLADLGVVSYLSNISFSPLGDRLIVIDEDRRVCLRNASDGKILFETIVASMGPVTWAPNGEIVYLNLEYKNIYAYRALDGKLLWNELDVDHFSSVWSEFKMQSERIVLRSKDKKFWFYDARHGKRLANLSKEGLEISGCEFSPSGKLMICKYLDGYAHMSILWDAESGKYLRSLGALSQSSRQFSFDKSEERVFSTDVNKVNGKSEIKVWQTNSQEAERTLEYADKSQPDKGDCKWPEIMPGGRFASYQCGSSLLIWDLEAEKIFKIIKSDIQDLDRFFADADLKHAVIWKHWADGNASMLKMSDSNPVVRYRDEGGAVLSLNLSSDGETLAAGDEELVNIWDLKSGKLKTSFPSHRSQTNIGFDPKSNRVSMIDKAQSRVWVRNLDQSSENNFEHKFEKDLVAFGKEGRFIVEQKGDQVKIFDLVTEKYLSPFSSKSSSSSSLTMSDDEKWLLEGNTQGEIHIWDIFKGEMLQSLGKQASVEALALSPDGKTLLAGLGDSSIRFWDLSKGMEASSLNGLSQSVHSLAVDPSGKHFAFADSMSTQLWDFERKKWIRNFAAPRLWVKGIDFSQDGSRYVVRRPMHAPELWDSQSGRMIRGIGFYTENRVILNADGSSSVSEDFGRLIVENSGTGESFRVIENFGSKFTSWIFSLDGRSLLTGDMAGNVKIWDLRSKREGVLICKKDNPIDSLLLSGNGGYLAVVCESSARVSIWNLSNRSEAASFRWDDWRRALALSHDGKTVAYQKNTGKIAFWDVKTQKEVREWSGPESGISFMIFSPDGKRMAVGSRDAKLTLCSVLDGAVLKTLDLGRTELYSAVFIENGKRLAVGSADGALIWDYSSGEVRVLENSQRGYRASKIDFSSDGKFLFGLGLEGIAGLTWDVDKGREIQGGENIFWNADGDGYGTSSLSEGQLILKTNGTMGEFDIWDLKTTTKVSRIGWEVETLDNHSYGPSYWLNSGIVTKDQRVIFTGADDGVLRAWNIKDRKVIWKKKLGSQRVDVVSLSPDGKAVFAEVGDRTFVMDAERGHAKGNFRVGLYSQFCMGQKHFYAAGLDGSIHIWDWAKGIELARLISTPDGWVVATAQGYFDGSDEGIKSLRWTVGLESRPLEDFYKGFYRPGLLAELLAGVKLPDPKFEESIKKSPLAKISAGPIQEVNGQGLVEILVETTSRGLKLGEVKLRLGEIRVDPKLAKLDADGKLRYRVKLKPGENTLRVNAFSRGDQPVAGPDDYLTLNNQISIDKPKQYPSYTFDRGDQLMGGSDDSLTPNNQTSIKKPILHVVAVGINAYSSPWTNTPYCEEDAQAIGGLLKKEAGDLFDDVNLHLVTGTDATGAEILGSIESIVANPEDMLLVFLAGHGSKGIDKNDKWFFVPRDLNLISMEDLAASMSRVQVDKKIILMDSCYSGGTIENELDRRGFDQLIHETGQDWGICILAGARGDQEAEAESQFGHGTFSRVLLEGLAGAGLYPFENKVSTSGLIHYTGSKLKIYSKGKQFLETYNVGTEIFITKIR